MSSDPDARLMPRLVTFAVWALLAASAAYWALGARKAGGPAALPVAAPTVQPDSAAVARLLGQRGSAPVVASAPVTNNRFKLVGVLARGGEQGAALISVDGKPAQPFRVGGEVEAGLVLQSVQARSATLAPRGSSSSGGSDARGAAPSPPTRLELPLLDPGGLSFGSAR